MDFERLNKGIDNQFDESINLREIIEKYLVHIKWFLLSIFLGLIFAFLKLRYTVPAYEIKASILIRENERGNSFTDLGAFEDFGFMGIMENNIENEIQILKSNRLMEKVVTDLHLDIRYFIKDSPLNNEIFPNFPLIVNFLNETFDLDKVATNFEIEVLSDVKYSLRNNENNFFGTFNFGDSIEVNIGTEELPLIQSVEIELNPNFNQNIIGETVLISKGAKNAVVQNYVQKVLIEPVNERYSNVLNLAIEEPILEKGRIILLNLIEQYNLDGINDKNEKSQATIDFLDSRIKLISTQLNAIESTAEQFKTQKGVIDVNVGSEVYIESSSLNERELIEANTEREMALYMTEELNKIGEGELLPGNIGLSEPSILNMIDEYNSIVLQRNRVMKSSSSLNPIVVNLDSQLAVVKNNLTSSLNNLNSSLRIKINGLNNQRGKISSRIAAAPKNEKEYKDIVREQEIKNALYLFLLQKREESFISGAVNVNKAKLIDVPNSKGIPVSPKKIMTYLASLAVSFLIPFLIIFMKNLLDTKVQDENDLKQLRIPYLGDIPLGTHKNKLFIRDGDNTEIAESFRYVRTNLSFMLDNQDVCKTIFITSTQSGEGKTFTAINLASSLAISGKRTLLLALDLRAPKIADYLQLDKNIKGVTDYIKDKNLSLNDIITRSTGINQLHFISSGEIPPNPVELLMSKRVTELFELLKADYEFIIVDTAPVGLVTDTIQVSKYADLTIYLIKANFIDKRMLHIPVRLYDENKLNNMAILMNCSNHDKGAYGYGYGYGYGKKKKLPWYKRIYSFNAF